MTSQLIRFDGFYVNKSFHPKYNNYIRFYENGAALVIDANAEKHPPENVANWFYITNPKRHIWQFAVSKYETEGDNIHFYVMYAGANVEYSGIAKEDSLQFESIQKTFKNYPKELKKLEEFEFYSCQLPEEDPIKVSLAYEVFCKSVKHNPIDDAQMVWVPSGEFTMGSNDHFKDEKPQHAVFLDGFWIYKYPITVGQYRKFLASQGKQLPRLDNWEWLANHPVVKVTWEDAYNYTKWAGVELPTEAQWEKAARGGDARIYPWGNDWNKNNCAIKRKGGTVPIAALWAGQSPYGVLDMAGNVYEWCADWYDADYYREAPTSNPKGPESGKLKVRRGGSWSEQNQTACRTSARSFSQVVPPSVYSSLDTGFRCVLNEEREK